MNSSLKLVCFFILALALGACQESEYQRLVKAELASGVRHDSIMFGINFGDSSKEFYTKCWELNKEGMISHGPKNMNVQYTIRNPKGSDIAMMFYPAYDSNGGINKMDLEFSYIAWSPWNKQLQADQLLPVVKDTLERWYPGNRFVKMPLESDTIFVKIDGNRRISMKSDGKINVLVKMIDMTNQDN